MPIPNPNPLVIPPTEAKSYPDLWIYGISVHAPAIATGSIRIETLPANMATGEIASGDYMQPLQTDKLWQAAAEVPEVAAAMGAIIAAVGPLAAWIKAQETPSEPEPEPLPN